MKRILTLIATLLIGCHSATAQTRKVIDELNKSGFWIPYVQWLESDERMRSYLMDIDSYSVQSLKNTLEAMESDHERARELLSAKKAIVGKKKGRKAEERLAQHFTDVTAAMRAFEAAEAAERRIDVMRSAIRSAIRTRSERTMPTGRLKSFHYQQSNGFGGFRHETSLTRHADRPGGVLTISNQRMMAEEDLQQKPAVVEVPDTVLQRVRDIVEQGRLYQVGRSYMPDFDILDASSWSMDIDLEGGSISSNGYAAGPDYSDALDEILNYLKAVADTAAKE